ncbi:hypothetical protein QWJ34_16580 [Saccharibacillus sp. CPCC 101409]|uniref:hypothetical protein n=1 Tax=Saccharibacillus sp. CPCC 101409 TaxID=3058041 RepID=UPI0026720815|nr:hypothetical protein [Saccharibacillus sp. CPCC 101409]MDO3411384.1 hypothetical protein [Saccharibacillus sp. CPCC 101409]
MRKMLLLPPVLAALSGCAQSAPDSAVSSAVQPDPPPVVESDTFFDSSLQVDTSVYKHDERYRDLIGTLEQALFAIENRDRASFAEAYATPQQAEGDLFWLDENVQFYGSITLTDRRPEMQRIDVGLKYRDSDNEKKSGTTAVFKPDANGDWKLVILD